MNAVAKSIAVILVLFSFSGAAQAKVNEAPSQAVSAVYIILTNHGVGNKDAMELAQYYARAPEVVALLTSLKDKKWSVNGFAGCTRKEWSVEVTWKDVFQMDVKNMVVCADFRKGEKVGFARRRADPRTYTLSPADALLHELEHAWTAFYEPETIKMSSGLSVDYANEHDVIARERELMKALTRADGQKRALRRSHSGTPVAVSCATCVE